MSESILIADDSVLVRESIETALRVRGARVEVVNDGTQALERLRDAAPDLVIADVHMPGVDGYGVCRETKAQRPACRVLLLVGTFEPFDSGAASSARADGVVRKPFLADEILRKVEDLLGPVRPRDARAGTQSGRRSTGGAAHSGGARARPGCGAGRGDRRRRRFCGALRRRHRSHRASVLELGGAEAARTVARELLGEASSSGLSAQRRSSASAEHPRAASDWRGDPERE